MTRERAKLVFVSFLIVFSLATFIEEICLTQTNEEVSIYEAQSESVPLVSKFWVMGPIEIDDLNPMKNWSYTNSTYDWCNGSGTWADPYVIENVTIDAGGSGSCITISNSNVFFTIRNSTFTGAGNSESGIKLESTSNGILLNNTCENNYYGIYLFNYCDNNLILNNTVFNNNLDGIVLDNYCDNNSIINNDIFYSAIYFKDYCKNNNIIANKIKLNSILLARASYNNLSENRLEEGRITLTRSDWNNITRNEIKNDDYGERILDSNNNDIFNNTIVNCNEQGIEFDNGDLNNFTQNLMKNSKMEIYFWSSNNIFKNNTFRDFQGGIAVEVDDDCGTNNFFLNKFINNQIHSLDDCQNTIWNNSETGNYWDDYPHIDGDNDGFGDFPYEISGDGGRKD